MLNAGSFSATHYAIIVGWIVNIPSGVRYSLSIFGFARRDCRKIQLQEIDNAVCPALNVRYHADKKARMGIRARIFRTCVRLYTVAI